jgi:hypothetical protein
LRKNTDVNRDAKDCLVSWEAAKLSRAIDLDLSHAARHLLEALDLTLGI